MQWPLFIKFTEVLQNLRSVFRVADFFDILLVAFLIYLVLILLKRTRSYFVLGGIVLLFVVYSLAHFFHFYLTTLLLQYFFTFLIVILVVVFQRELRNFFEWIFVLGLFARRRTRALSPATSTEIIEAIGYMVERKIGSLIVLPGVQPVDRFLEGGFELEGQVSKNILTSIFDPSSPGHDGAVVIEGDRIKKFGVHLPLAEKFQAYKELGTRHRSALGLSERTDALILAVSEERGTISVAHNGELKVIESVSLLQEKIKKFLAEGEPQKKSLESWLTQNTQEKLIAFLLALLLWSTLVFPLLK